MEGWEKGGDSRYQKATIHATIGKGYGSGKGSLGTEQEEETEKVMVTSERSDRLTDYTPTIRFHAIFFQYTCFGLLFCSVLSLTSCSLREKCYDGVRYLDSRSFHFGSK